MPQINTNIPSAIGEGKPNIAEKIAITIPATNATEIWLPTKAPILETIPAVSALIGASLLGLVGGILAVPIAASILLILEEVVYPKSDQA